MPQAAWSNKRERQYKHIKSSLKKRGTRAKKAEEIAARTVNKERARSGEAKNSSKLSRTDISSGRRAGLRANRSGGPRGRTREQLYEEAKSSGIKGRSRMNKRQLVAALNRKKGG
jgi:plasmid stabilization system protein ParE